MWMYMYMYVFCCHYCAAYIIDPMFWNLFNRGLLLQKIQVLYYKICMMEVNIGGTKSFYPAPFYFIRAKYGWSSTFRFIYYFSMAFLACDQ